MVRLSKWKSLNESVNVALQNCVISLLLSCVVVYFLPVWLRECLVNTTGVLILSIFLASLVNNWRRRKNVNAQGKAVFITGCDSGFGHMLAKDLDKARFQVFAGCLFPDGEGAQDLKKQTSPTLSIVPLDVTCDESINAAVQHITSKLGDNELWALVNNAGINDGGEIFWTNFDTIRKVLDVNLFGVVKVTKAFLPLLCTSEGRVVTVCSAAGRNTVPSFVPYCMSKSAAIAFCDGLRQEMYRFNVNVISVEPTFFRTPIIDKSPEKKTWENAADEVKQFYPRNYGERIENRLSNFVERCGINNRPQEAVDSMKEAVMAENPKYCYRPGLRRSLISSHLLNILPKPINDYLILSNFRNK